MSRWHHINCPNKSCNSSDAFSYKEGDEWGYCFSCNTSSPINALSESTMTKPTQEATSKLNIEDIAEYPIRGFQERAIKKTVTEFYKVRVSYDTDGSIDAHFYPYTKNNTIVAYKERKLPKKFTTHGDFKHVELFGQSLFPAGGRKLVVTEGELDCLSVAQAQHDHYNVFYPVVSLASASQTKQLLEQREWVRSFDEVVLCLDNDEAGKKALAEAAKIIGFDKVRVAQLTEKDPSDVLVKKGAKDLLRAIWDAKAYSPAGMIKGQAIWDQFKERQATKSVPYPACLEGLNEKTLGMRTGEIVLFTSGTGSGKSTVTKEIILELKKTTDDLIGIVSLEESIGDTAQKFIAMELQKNLNEEVVSEEDQYKAFTEVFGDERIILLDHQGSVSDESLTDKIEHLALLGCKYIVLDHITIAVSEGANGKTGNEAVDYVMSELLKITKKHNIWLGIVSHLRKGEKPFEEGHLPTIDDIKGSGSIKQISFDIISFARNMVHEDERIRNTIKFRVLKSRFTGKTGNAGSTEYNPKTGRLSYNTLLDFE